jgi:FkbM family methyltransferase
MSDLNLCWLQENFLDDPMILFNIGCADITDDTFRFSVALPNARVHSFECSDIWKESNLQKSLQFGFDYHHKAVSYYDGTATFYCDQPHNDFWQYRGRLIDPALQNDQGPWGKETVEVISLNRFCRGNNLRPNFLHIDVEGEEYNILKNLDEELFPEAIWLEYWHRYHDGIGGTVDFEVLDSFLQHRGYRNLFQKNDVLYVKNTMAVTPYNEYQHYTAHNLPISSAEKIIQKKIWIARYSICKDQSWPDLDDPADFFHLPSRIQNECATMFDLVPPNDII